MSSEQRPTVPDTAVLRPPGGPDDPAADTPGGHRWLWLVLAVLLLLALAVIFALPAAVVPEDTAGGTPSSPPPLVQAGDSAGQREAAHQALQRYLQLRARLELENAAAWGEPDWREAAARASAGDHNFALRQFAAAARDYQSALDQLQRLEANRAVLLASALEEGERALVRNDVETAIARFEAALVIEAGHADATRGLARARSRHASIEQLDLGLAAEAEGDLEAARGAYLEATQQDASHAEAVAALQRVTALINARKFTAAMSRGLAALDAGKAAEAEAALVEAEQLQPGETAVRDARQRLRAMQSQAALSGLQRRAAEKVRSEDWQAAVVLYRQALSVDPAAGFAGTGLRHAEQRLKLHAQFDHYLNEPARLYSATPLANAKQLLAAASSAPPGEPLLAKKIAALRDLVARAGTPLSVTLHSDGATSVVIYRVGRLGRFDTHQLELLPGDYTVVGSRPGYRDVRKVIRLRPGIPTPPLVVRCEEAI